MIKIVFSKNNKIGSKLISATTAYLSDKNKTPSHTAILVKNKWIIESTLDSGFRAMSYKEWLSKNELIYIIAIEESFANVKELFKKLKSKKYDYFGVLYLSYRLLLNKAFGIKIPTKNKLHKKSKYFCCEVIGELLHIDTQMMTPVELLDVILARHQK